MDDVSWAVEALIADERTIEAVAEVLAVLWRSGKAS